MAKKKWKCCPSPRLDPQPDGGTVCTSCGAEQLGLGVVASKPSRGNEAEPKAKAKKSSAVAQRKLQGRLAACSLHLSTMRQGPASVTHPWDPVPCLYKPLGEVRPVQRGERGWVVEVKEGEARVALAHELEIPAWLYNQAKRANRPSTAKKED